MASLLNECLYLKIFQWFCNLTKQSHLNCTAVLLVVSCSNSKKFKSLIRVRLFPPDLPSPESAAASQSSGAPVPGKPLANLSIAIIGKTVKKKADLTKMITELGGKVVAAVDGTLAACISTAGQALCGGFLLIDEISDSIISFF